MNFAVVTSPLDKNFDPHAEYQWLVSKGLINKLEDYEVRDNELKNKRVKSAIYELLSRLKNINRNTDSNIISDAFNRFDQDFVVCHRYSEESTKALCDFLIFITEKNSVFESINEEVLRLGERFITNYLQIFSLPQIPRPVAWHLVNTFLKSEFFLTGRDMQNYMGHAITENPLCGDALFLAYCDASYPNKDKDLPLLGTNQAFMNPSLTLKSLERLAVWYITDSDYGSSLDFLHYDNKLFQFNFNKYNDDFYVTEEGLLSIVDFAIVIARVLDEVKLGRLTINDLALSRSKYLRTILFYLPGVLESLKSEAEKLGVMRINAVTQKLIIYSFENPYISALNHKLSLQKFV